MKVLCTICARAGSKGVPNKNIRSLCGIPLIAHTIKQALNLSLIDKIVVSTDSEEIASIAKAYGAEVPFKRPQSLADDESPKLPVIKHALRYCIDELGYHPDYVVDLDPTSPLRSVDDIRDCLNFIINDSDCDSLVTGYRSNKNPYFNMVEVNSDGFVHLSKESNTHITSRQTAPVVYSMNASIYVWKTGILLQQSHILSGKVKFFEMPQERSVDIDSELDFKLVELILKEEKENEFSE